MSEKTEFEIALRDSISPSLRQISRELKSLTKGIAEGAGHGEQTVNKFNVQQSALARGSRAALRDIESMGSFFVGFGKGLLGVGGSIATVKSLYEGISDLATNRVQLVMFSKDTRLATDDIEKITAGMARMGISAENAKGMIGGLTAKLQDLSAQKEGSQLYQDLSAMGEKGNIFAQQLINEKDYMKKVELILENFKNQTPDAQHHLSQLYGVPVSVLENLEKNMAKYKGTPSVPDEVAQNFLDQQARLREKLDSEWTLWGAHAMEKINAWFKQLDEAGGSEHALSDMGIALFDKMAGMIDQDIKDVTALIKLYEAARSLYEKAPKPDEAKKNIQERFEKFGIGKQSNRFDETFDQFKEKKKEENQLLKGIDELLKRMSFSTASVDGGGGGGGGGGEEGSDGPSIPAKGGQRPQATETSRPSKPAQGGEKRDESDQKPTGDAPEMTTKPGETTAPEVTEDFKKGVDAFIVHHTGGGKTVQDIRNTLNQRGLGVEYIMDREGNIVASGPRGSSHMMTGWGKGAGLSNRNTVGMEIIAKDDKDVTDAQRDAARRFIEGNYGNIPVYGHGEVNPGHKEADEGMKVVSAIRADRAKQRKNMDQDSDSASVWKKGGNSIAFTFSNVPPGVRTNADADGSFTDVKISRKSAMEQRAPD